jgi:hypothetical protein
MEPIPSAERERLLRTAVKLQAQSIELRRRAEAAKRCSTRLGGWQLGMRPADTASPEPEPERTH